LDDPLSQEFESFYNPRDSMKSFVFNNRTVQGTTLAHFVALQLSVVIAREQIDAPG